VIKFFARRKIKEFSQHYSYNTDYMERILEADTVASLKFSALQMLSGHRRGIPGTPWAAAQLRATLSEDCGPCAQLVADMAVEEGMDPIHIASVLSGDYDALPPELALAARFADRVLAHDPSADDLRPLIIEKWGEPGLVSLGLTISVSRVYPMLKYAMGYGKACSRVQIGEQSVVPRGAQSQEAMA